MSSRLDRRRSARSRCRSRGAGASLRCAAARPKKGQAEEPYRRRGPPAGRTNRSQPTRHIPGHPRWPFSCTAVWPHRRIVSRDIDLRARRWQRCLLALSSEAGVPQLVIASSGRVDPARERQRAVTSSMPWCGSISSREARRRAFRSIRQRSPRSSRLSDRNCFPRKPHRIARREPPVDSNRPGQQWTDVRGQAGERSQAPGRGQADLAVEYPV
jgi:hypothetical protein